MKACHNRTISIGMYLFLFCTEPFGNYLCQKLIEHCDDAQRDILVETVAPDLLKISLNMHGTRAVQKFIEFLSTPQQVWTFPNEIVDEKLGREEGEEGERE